jgi:hypothetical protein
MFRAGGVLVWTLYQSHAFGSDVAHPLAREQGHGGRAGKIIAPVQNHGMAEAS